jgi:hypothetical protein
MADRVLVDLSAVTTRYEDAVLFDALEAICNERGYSPASLIRVEFGPDAERWGERNSWHRSYCRWLGSPYSRSGLLRINSLDDYAGALDGCRGWIGLHSGGASLAAAIRRERGGIDIIAPENARERHNYKYPDQVFHYIRNVPRQDARATAREDSLFDLRELAPSARAVFVWHNRRSGSHAIIHWMCANAGIRAIHFNNVGMHGHDGKLSCWEFGLYDAARGICRPCVRSPKAAREFVGRHAPGLVVISLQEKALGALDPAQYGFADARSFVVVRSARNWVASAISGWNDGASVNARARWREYAEAVECGAIEGALFDRWFADDAYRLGLAERLGLPTADKGRDYVPEYGGGSSFDGTRYQGRAEAMDVLKRADAFASVPGFEDLIDEEMRRLDAAMFGG